MTTEGIQSDWTELRGKIKAKWSKLADADLDKFKGNMHLIAERLRAIYGYTEDKAEQEYSDFKKTLGEKPPAAEVKTT